MLSRWLVFHVASGQSFFSGSACLAVALCLSAFAKWPWKRIVRNIFVLIGGSLVFASATPLSPWFYLVLLIATLLWLAGEASRGRVPHGFVRFLRVAVALVCFTGVDVELPYHFLPSVPQLGRPALGIIGDSVTAGTGQEAVITWPGILADRYGIVVHDHSQMGANVASALGQVASVSSDERLVLLEIGGNDLLGDTTPEAFEAGLAKVLSALHRPGRVVVMLELPLPPTYNAYGRIQRRLARRYQTLLVPKRVLLGILQHGGTTLDTIHLNQDGHRRMADAIWNVMKTGYIEVNTR